VTSACLSYQLQQGSVSFLHSLNLQFVHISGINWVHSSQDSRTCNWNPNTQSQGVLC